MNTSTAIGLSSKASVPTFTQATNRRQKARAAGLHPDYWYPVEYDRAIKPGQVKEVVFWRKSIALFRDQAGQLTALENRCAHRQLKLSLGNVSDCRLICTYHGWQYNAQGEVVDFSHDLFGRPKPPYITIATYPVQVRYGLIWIFPGNRALCAQRRIPDISELETEKPWPCVPVDFIWPAHHSMIIENVCDFTHAYLHRKYRPFSDAKLTRNETCGDRVFVGYDTKVGRGPVSRHFVDAAVDTNHMDLCYDYPYQWSNTDNQIKNWCFVLPIDERTTRVFFLFYFARFKIPFTRLHIPQVLTKFFLKMSKQMLIRPLLAQDGTAVTAEQNGYEQHYSSPPIELNPMIHEFQEITIRKWEEYVGSK
jgi:phenylpropionate dioxygenase-like ring-hydroxylating dioxygenase large terminal subunit